MAFFCKDRILKVHFDDCLQLIDLMLQIQEHILAKCLSSLFDFGELLILDAELAHLH